MSKVKVSGNHPFFPTKVIVTGYEEEVRASSIKLDKIIKSKKKKK